MGSPFEKRRRIMDAWATFCATAPKPEKQDDVAPLRQVG